MKEIGWIDSNNNMSVDNSTNSNAALSDYKSPMTSPTKKKTKPNLNQNFVPFDYSKADFGTETIRFIIWKNVLLIESHSDAPQQVQSTQQHFSPYKDFKDPGRVRAVLLI